MRSSCVQSIPACALEIAGLQWDDVDFNSGYLTVRRSYSHGRVNRTKTAKIRRVDLSRTLQERSGSAQAPQAGGMAQAGTQQHSSLGLLANQLQRRLKQARFPVMKTLEKTGLKLWPGVDALRLRELAECEWIGRRENLALIGRHGTGKSHAATVLGVDACRRTHRALFTTAAELTTS